MSGESPASGPSARFMAEISGPGVNPFVQVPSEVSAAGAGIAGAARVRFAGTLDGVPIRGNLVPAGGGRHRLYLNGGMRAAAQVAVGDVVEIVVRPQSGNDVSVPEDVATALRAAGATERFASLAPSHRRELLRHVDDARSPSRADAGSTQRSATPPARRSR